jgi:hypothetical protein
MLDPRVTVPSKRTRVAGAPRTARTVGTLIFSVLVSVSVAVLAPPTAEAEPYLAVRFGAKCSDCHTNLTGGGKRTPFVAMHSRDILHDLDLLPLPARVEAFNGDLTDFLSIGADLRAQNTYSFKDDLDANGRVPNDRFFREELDSIDFNVPEGVGYLEVDLLPDVLTFYVDQQFADSTSNREAFGLIQIAAPWSPWLKAGRFFFPYGLSIQDDTAYVRSFTGVTFDNTASGAEVGVMPGPFFLTTAVTDAGDGDRNVVVTVNGYALLQDVPVVRNVIAGASWQRPSPKRNIAAFYAGANLWRFTYLAEVDLITDNRPNSSPRDQLAAYAEINWLLFDWLNVRGTYDFVKIGSNNDRNRFGIGIEPFINRFLQPRLVYRAANAPSTNVDGNRAELILEMHMFF